MEDNRKRSLAKTISWRMVATIATVGIVYAFTSKIVLSLGIGAVEFILKMALYYLHERLWARAKWGKHSLAAAQAGEEFEYTEKGEIRAEAADAPEPGGHPGG